MLQFSGQPRPCLPWVDWCGEKWCWHQGGLLEEGEDVNDEDKSKILKKVWEENFDGKINE